MDGGRDTARRAERGRRMGRLRILPLCLHSLSLQVSSIGPRVCLRSKGAKALRHPVGAVDNDGVSSSSRGARGDRALGPSQAAHHLQWHLVQPRGVRSRPPLSLHGCTAPAGYPSDSSVGPRKPGRCHHHRCGGAARSRGRSCYYRYACDPHSVRPPSPLRGLCGLGPRVSGAVPSGTAGAGTGPPTVL